MDDVLVRVSEELISDTFLGQSLNDILNVQGVY